MLLWSRKSAVARAIASWVGVVSENDDFRIQPVAEVLSPWLRNTSRGKCQPEEELHGETHVGSEELKCVERHAANEIGWEEVAPRDARLEAIATESLGAGIDEQALHRTERDVIDAESLVCKLQEGDPELDILDLGQLQSDRPGTFGDGESLIQAVQEMSRERDHVGDVVESTEHNPERFTGHA
jgi:hypothetical protein